MAGWWRPSDHHPALLLVDVLMRRQRIDWAGVLYGLSIPLGFLLLGIGLGIGYR